MLKECRVPFPRSAPRPAATSKDSARNTVLAMVTHNIPRTAVYDLAYPVHTNSTNNTVVAIFGHWSSMFSDSAGRGQRLPDWIGRE